MKHLSMSVFSLLFVFSFYASIGWGETLAECNAKCSGDTAAIEVCKNKCAQTVEANSEERAEKKEKQNRCDQAEKDMLEARDKNPCGAESSAKACYDKIDSCVESSQAAFSGSEDSETSTNALMGTALQLFGASKSTEQNSASNFKVDRSCYSTFNSKSKNLQDAEKERQTRLKELKKDIEEETKKQNEATKDLNKEKNEVAQEEQKLNNEFKKFKATQEKNKREKFTQINEEIQKNSSNIRSITTAIVKAKESRDRIQFEFQKSMIQYTEDKINQQCKSALETAKACFVKANKGQPAGKDDVCSNFTFSGKGISGTAALKAKLLQVRQACFEQASQSVSTMKYDQAEKLRAAERDIQEKQSQIEDANKALELKQKEFDAVTKETDAETTQEEQNVSQQITNLREKISNLITDTNKLIADSKAVIEDRQKQINELAAGKLAHDLGMDDNGRNYYTDVADEAKTLLGKIRSAEAIANERCCANSVRLPTSSLCKGLAASAKEAERKAQRRVRTESKR